MKKMRKILNKVQRARHILENADMAQYASHLAQNVKRLACFANHRE